MAEIIRELTELAGVIGGAALVKLVGLAAAIALLYAAVKYMKYQRKGACKNGKHCSENERHAVAHKEIEGRLIKGEKERKELSDTAHRIDVKVSDTQGLVRAVDEKVDTAVQFILKNGG